MNQETNDYAVQDAIKGIEVSAPVQQLGEATIAVDLARVEVDQLIATAHRFPRNIKTLTQRLADVVLLDEASAENAIYILPRAKKAIPGPSIGFANALASVYGNCWDYGLPVYVDRREKKVIALGTCVDWESNRRTTIYEHRRAFDRHGRLYDDDMILVTGKAAAAIARRNAILQCVSRSLWFPVYEQALRAVRGNIETLAERRDVAIKALAKFGISSVHILAYLDKKKLDEIGIEDMPTLRGMYRTLAEGAVTPEELFDPRKMTSGRTFYDSIGDPLGDEDDDGGKPAEVSSGMGPEATGTFASEMTSSAPARTNDYEDPGYDAETGEVTPEGEAKETVQESPKRSQADEPMAPEDRKPASAKKPAAAKKKHGDAAPTGAEPTPKPKVEAAQAKADPFPQFPDAVKRTGDEYLAYLREWAAEAKTASEVDDRFKGERELRNSLGETLTTEQMNEARKIKADREAALRKGAQQ